MSPFAIFAIVFTLGCLLYYAAMIAFDLKAYNKKAGREEETIAADAECEEEFQHTPKSVVEDPETGGFNFVTPEPEPAPTIAEAEEETTSTVEESSITTSEEKPLSYDVPIYNNVEEAQEGREEPLSSDEGEELERQEQEEEDFGLTTIKYAEEQPEEREDKPVDVSEAFDASLTEPKFDVASIVEPHASAEVVQKSQMVNAALESNLRFGNEHTPLVLSNVLRDKELTDEYNIETRDEVTKQ